MKLEKQVVSLNIAKRLKELGVKQESLFFHAQLKITGEWQIVDWQDMGMDSDPNIKSRVWKNYTPAFTVAELGEMLPNRVNLPLKNGKPRASDNVLKAYFGKNVKKNQQCVPQVIYAKTEGNEYLHEHAETEADARGKMLIYLLENKLLTL